MHTSRPTNFRIAVPDEVLEDLGRRLLHTRWPSSLMGEGWDYGINTDYLRMLVGYWRNEYRWREREAMMNALPQYCVDVDGMRLHFVYLRASATQPGTPIVLLHGWPGTFLEMVRLGEYLASPREAGAIAYDVIIPSLPGFGFSATPTQPGFGYMRVANLLHQLLSETLGYARYAAHGTDVGGFVASWMGLHFPDSVIGLHMLEGGIPQPSLLPPAPPPTPAELQCLEEARQWELREGAYAHLQRTRPQTLAVGLNDSPAALAAWLVEKYRVWSDCDGDVERRYSKDDLLDIVTLYWVTQSAPSSVRAYYERQHADRAMAPLEKLRVPTGIALTPKLPGHPPRHWPREYVERSHNIVHWVDLPAGGHFVSWEEPALVCNSIRQFMRLVS